MERLLTVEEVAEKLQVTRRYARDIMVKMPHIVLGGTKRKTIRVTEADLAEELNSRTRRRTPEQVQRVKRRRQLVRDGLMTSDGRIARKAQKRTPAAGAN